MYLATVEAAYFCSGRKAMNGANVLIEIGNRGVLVIPFIMFMNLPWTTHYHFQRSGTQTCFP